MSGRAAYWQATVGDLSNRPALVLAVVRCLMVATLLTVLCGSLYLQFAFDGLRATTNDTVARELASRELVAALDEAVAEERGARLAADWADLRDMRARFDAAARHARQAVGALGSTAVTSLDAGTTASIRRLAGAVDPALAALRAMMPAAPGVAPARRPEDGAVLGPALAAAADLDRAALHRRQLNVHRIQRRERLDIGASLTGLTLFVILLGGGATRLIEGRERLLAVRRAATLQTQLLVGAVNHMPEAVAVYDADDRLILCNARFVPVGALPGHCAEVGASFAAVASSLALAEPNLLEAPRPDLGRPIAGEMRLAGRVLAVWRTAMPTGGQMLTLADVTERVAAEEVARRAQRMEALGRLTGGVAHDFNNLLQALAANLDVLAAAAGGDENPRLRVLALEALAAVERGQRLTRHLLAFARRQELDAVALDTSSILAGLRDLLSRTLGDTIEVRLSAEPVLWPVLGDRAGLENALLNLALNARDAMPKGGGLTITARNLPGPEGQTAAATVVDHVRIVVADEGVGMTEQQMARAVEPFFTTKPLGSGLGLAVVDGFARQSGGVFRLRSVLGHGTEAILELPRASAMPPVVDRAPVRPERGRGETILLVEDDRAVAAAAREALRMLDYQVVEAHDVEAACALLGAGLCPDLILTDVMMPGPLGVRDLALAARAIHADLPILFNTGDIEAPALGSVVFDANMALLGKPWRLAELSRMMRSMLDRAQVPALEERA